MQKRIFFLTMLLFTFLCFDVKAQPGSIDYTFNPIDRGFGFGDGADDAVSITAIQNDGKIIIGGGFEIYNGTLRNHIARLNIDGHLDTTFNVPMVNFEYAYSIAIQNDGKIVIVTNYKIARLNYDGSLDTTFNVGTSVNDEVHSIAIQNDGKIIIGGYFTSYNGVPRKHIARLNPDGNLDTTFNINTDLSGDVLSISIQNDEKIIIGGYFSYYDETFTPRNCIARLNTDGSIDSTFDAGSGLNERILTTSIQSDGKIIIGGRFTTFNGIQKNYIVRLNPDGSLDNSFNIGTGTNDWVNTTTIQNDGKIIIGGNFTVYNGIIKNRIVRMHLDGSIDTTFNIGTGFNNSVYAISIKSDGKIITGGNFSTYNEISSINMVCFDTIGKIDFSFNVGTGANSQVLATAIQNDGKIIIGGSFTFYNGKLKNHIVRLNIDGSIDSTFNVLLGADNLIRTISIQSDGKIIIGGYFTSCNGITKNNLARLNNDGSIDSTFNASIGTDSWVQTISIQSNGKIIIGGYFTSYNGIAVNHLACLNTDGSLDTTFNTTTEIINFIWTTAIQNDGKILIGGQFWYNNETSRRHISRLNTDGSLDTTFIPGTGASDVVHTISIQNDGKIIIGGQFTSINGTSSPHIARLYNNGSVDSTFVIGLGADNYVFSSAVQNDGKIIIGGGFSSYNGTQLKGIVRLNINGSRDTTFNVGVGIYGNYSYYCLYSISIQNNKRIIIGGFFTSYNGEGRNRIARLNGDCINTTSSITETVCNSYILNGITYYSTGTYTQIILNATGCDSIITINLTVNPTLSFNNVVSICQGQNYIINGHTYTTEGTYIDTLHSINSCDSIILTSITVNPTYSINNTVSICQGENYIFNGHTYTTTGIYSDTLHTIIGCDSIIITNLIVKPLSAIHGVALYSGGFIGLGDAKVILYKDSTNGNHIQVDSVYIGLNGSFSFQNIINGSYYVYVKLNNHNAPYQQVFSSYYDSTFRWQDAYLLNLICGVDTNIIIHMFEKGQTMIGNGNISGNINFFSTNGGKTVISPVTNGEVYIELEPENEPISNSETDTSGVYKFIKLPIGSFTMYVDIPGFPMTQTYSGITVTLTDTLFTNLNFYVDTSDATAGIYTSENNKIINLETPDFSLKLFPNPVIKYLFIESINQNVKLTIEILDVNAKSLYKSTIDNNTKVDMTKFLQGIYLVKLQSNNNVIIKKIIKQ